MKKLVFILVGSFLLSCNDKDSITAYDGSVNSLVSFAKKHSLDSTSFEHIETKLEKKDSVYMATMYYTNKNGFGKEERNSITAILDSLGNLKSVLEYKENIK